MVSYKESWSSISDEDAKSYLHYYPKDGKLFLANHLRDMNKPIRLLEAGCGNAQNFSIFNNIIKDFQYTGVDFSEPLINAAKIETERHDNACICHDDVFSFFSNLNKAQRFDVIFISHVIELIESQDLLLWYAAQYADMIAILWYEPPIHDHQIIEMKEATYKNCPNTPYIRIKTSKDYYEHLLDKHNLRLEKRFCSGAKHQLDILKKVDK